MRRFFRILKWCALGLLGIVGIFLIVNGIRAARASARLAEKIAALRAAVEPISIADLARPPIPPEQNAETYLRRARSDIEAMDTAVNSADDAAPQADREAFSNGGLTPALQQTIAAILAAHPSAFALIEEASHCPCYDPEIDFQTDADAFVDNMLSAIQYWRVVFRVGHARVLVQLAEGHPEDALQTCLTLFRLARLFDHNPTIISQLVAIAIRGLAFGDVNLVLRSGPLPKSAYAALDQELALHDMIESSRQSLRSDRAYGIQAFGDMAIGDLAPTARWMPWFKNDECDYLDVMEMCIRDATLPYSEWNSKIDSAIVQEKVGPLTLLMLPALQAQHDAVFRIQAQFRALRVLNALLQREQAGDTGEPALTDLGLRAEVITDPFNGEPLHLKKLPTGWLIYSVGPNLKDDDGDLTEHLDVGVGPQPPTKADGDKEKRALGTGASVESITSGISTVAAIDRTADCWSQNETIL